MLQIFTRGGGLWLDKRFSQVPSTMEDMIVGIDAFIHYRGSKQFWKISEYHRINLCSTGREDRLQCFIILIMKTHKNMYIVLPMRIHHRTPLFGPSPFLSFHLHHHCQREGPGQFLSYTSCNIPFKKFLAFVWNGDPPSRLYHSTRVLNSEMLKASFSFGLALTVSTWCRRA